MAIIEDVPEAPPPASASPSAPTQEQEVQDPKEPQQTVQEANPQNTQPQAGDPGYTEGLPPEAAQEGEDVGQGVRKVLLQAGNAEAGKPVTGATVFAHYKAWVKSTGSKVFDTWEEGQQLEMTLGNERRNLKGLSVGLLTMNRGERALLHVPFTLAYGEEGSFSFPSVPPRSDMLYEVQLNGFDNPKEGRRQANFTVEERLESAEQRRQAGNELFKQEKTEEALAEYEMALGYMGEDFMMQMFGKYKDMADAVRIPCLLNSAACQLKLGKFLEAAGLCSAVLAEDKGNAKALFRRGKAYIALGQLDKALEDMRQAQKLAPGDSAVAKAIAEIKKEERALIEEEKRLFKGVLSSDRGGLSSDQPKAQGRGPSKTVARQTWLIQAWRWIQKTFSGLFSWLWRRKSD